MTISNNNLRAKHTLTWKELYAADFTFNTPFVLELHDKQELIAEQVVRIVPKRRVVVFGKWQEKSIVAKIFFDKQHAQRHITKEIKGIKSLQDNKIPTPAVLFQSESVDKKMHVLIFERIFDSESLEQAWQTSKNDSIHHLLYLFQPVVLEIATQHVLGVLQHDMHLKNYLLTEKTIYTLDGAQIEMAPNLLPKKPSMESLALFLAQLGVGKESLQEHLFKFYAKARGWLIKPDDVRELFYAIRQWNVLRWRRFAKKIMRNSTDYASLKKWHRVGMYDRRYAQPEFMQFLQDPEIAFTHPSTQFLKQGRSSTVVAVQFDQRMYVVKRYNMKDMWHKLRRCLRATRAAACWRLAHKMQLFDVATAKPIAFIENQRFGLRGKSYYVTEYIPGIHAGEYFNQDDQKEIMIDRIIALLKNLAKIDISHGDLKITNILVNENKQPVLIDLDGAIEHDSLASLRKAWHKEIKRFLENFSQQPTIQAKFASELLK